MVSAILVLGTFRIVRLIGWDEITKPLRNWAGGRNERNIGEPVFADDPRGTYTRPGLTRWLVCPWCQGFWVCCAVYIAWHFEPTATLYLLSPFALSAAVGLVSRWFDP